MDLLSGMPLAYFASGEDWGLLMVLGILPTVFWIVMLVDAIRREFRDSSMKLIWILVLLFTHLIGALIYFFVGRSMGQMRR